MKKNRTFPTTAAVRYDRALRKSLKLNPPPSHLAVPQFTCCWPEENIAFLERYRDWLVGIGAADSVINQHRIPAAGHVLGLALKPHSRLNLADDFDQALRFVEARPTSETWKANCRHSLDWFRRFVKEERGLVIIDKPSFGDVGRFQAGLPEWLIKQLTKHLHIRQANWRDSRMALSTYQFWYKSTRIWRWLFAHTGITEPKDVTRDHLFEYIDEQLVAKYKTSSINHDLHTFQGTLRFLQQQGMAIPHQLLTLPGLKKKHSLPRFLTDAQVVALRDDLTQRVKQAETTAAQRDARFDLAAFYLLWQSGMRVSELEDLRLSDVDFEAGQIILRATKGLKDRAVYLTERAAAALRQYLEMRGPALSDHLFIYRHKPLSKDIIRCRIKAAGERLGFKATPHMLRHTFATQLLNAGCRVTTIQSLLGHRRLNSTMVYARVHDQTVADDYYAAMSVIEAQMQFPPHLPPEPNPGGNDCQPVANDSAAHWLQLLDALQAEPLTESQQAVAAELQDGLATLVESLNGGRKQVDQIVNEQAADSPKPIPLP